MQPVIAWANNIRILCLLFQIIYYQISQTGYSSIDSRSKNHLLNFVILNVVRIDILQELTPRTITVVSLASVANKWGYFISLMMLSRTISVPKYFARSINSALYYNNARKLPLVTSNSQCSIENLIRPEWLLHLKRIFSSAQNVTAFTMDVSFSLFSYYCRFFTEITPQQWWF